MNTENSTKRIAYSERHGFMLEFLDEFYKRMECGIVKFPDFFKSEPKTISLLE